MWTDKLTCAEWKVRYEIAFRNTPKKLRKTKSQILNIRSQAKLLISINAFRVS